MSHPKNYIQINGRKYHAQTGQLIDDGQTAKPSEPARSPNTGVAMDGVKAKPAHPQPAKNRRASENVNRSVKHIKAKSTQHSTTLMRPAVKKPHHEPIEDKQPPPSVTRVPEGRRKRAGEVKKSPHIKKFSVFGFKPQVIKRHQPIEVAHPEPTAVETVHEKVDQFEQVIQDATSHLEEYVEEHTPKKYRKLAFATAGLSVILLAGFVFYQAVPNVKVQLASNKAGFDADLPGYSPAGYGLDGNIQSSSGEVTLAYNSRTDSKGYEVQQQPSNWNSQSLINNFLLAENKTYQTYENNGKTVYIYDNTNATWIDGGIWYKVVGDASLTSDQLLRIANGL